MPARKKSAKKLRKIWRDPARDKMETNLPDSQFNTLMEQSQEVGFVEIVSFQIVYASGLPNVVPKEIVLFESGNLGYVLSLSKDLVEILVLSKDAVLVGTRVTRTKHALSVPVGDALLGSSIDPLGYSIYENKPITGLSEYREIEVTVPGIEKRTKITQALETGVAVVDLMIPLGKGQRELVIGDRGTGKTDFVLQTMLTQSKKGVVCVYAAIAKQKLDVKKVEKFFAVNNMLMNTITVVSGASDPLGLIYLTPYSAMTIAEYYRDIGRDVLLVLDDLTTHAKYYREISLLSKRFPGKSSYPGDIFYLHSRLLERAGNFNNAKDNKGDTKNDSSDNRGDNKRNNLGTSITCIPVAETLEGDISGLIQTNIMSITDGHIYFDKDLFIQGRRPSINYFLSVTRVGRQTQSKLRWSINRELNTFLALFERSLNFSHFGAEVSEGVKSTLRLGDKVLKFFDQPMGRSLPMNVQIIMFCLLWLGIFDKEPEERIKFFIDRGMWLYDNSNDKSFKETIDGLINTSDDLNALLKKLTTKSKGIISMLDK